jgi:hypothetical protein
VLATTSSIFETVRVQHSCGVAKRGVSTVEHLCSLINSKAGVRARILPGFSIGHSQFAQLV